MPLGLTQKAGEEVELAERTAEALKLRARGYTYDAIAAALGYASKSGAYHAVERGLEQVVKQPAEQARAIELEKLDEREEMLAQQRDRLRKRFRDSESLDDDAINLLLKIDDRINRIAERRAKLIGLDMPAELRLKMAGSDDIQVQAVDYRAAVEALAPPDDEGDDDGNV